MANEGYPCGIGENDLEKCGPGLKCGDDGISDGYCVNPCATQAIRNSYGLNGNGTWYQNDPDKPQFGECIQGVGANNAQQGNGQQQTNSNNSNSFSKKSLPTTNRFCLCAIDVGCGPAPAPVAEDLEFNIALIAAYAIKRRPGKPPEPQWGEASKCRDLSRAGVRLTKGQWPLFTATTPWKTRDDNGEICVEGQCCKNGANGPAREVDVGGATAKECPPDFLYSLDQITQFSAFQTNGIFQGWGENTAGCEHMSWYGTTNFQCWHGSTTHNEFAGRVPEIFDINLDDYGAWSGFKIKSATPPAGSTYEINIYGRRGYMYNTVKYKLWVHEDKKDKTDDVIIKRAILGGGECTMSAPTSTKCPNVLGGPNPGDADIKSICDDTERLVGVITILPDGTWTLTDSTA